MQYRPGVRNTDITSGLSRALSPAKESHFAYFSEKEFQEFLNRLEADSQLNSLHINTITKLALKLLILTFVRIGEIRGAK
jgi:integrase